MTPSPCTPGEPAAAETIGGARGAFRLDPELGPALRARLAGDRPAEWPELTEVKSSRVRRILAGAIDDGRGGALHVHVKLFAAVRLSDRARDALGGSRGVKEFENLREARRRGLPAVRPLAAGRIAGTLGAQSFLVTATAGGGAGAGAFEFDLPADVRVATGRVLRAAHDAGMHARDLHPGNVLIDAGGEAHLCDLTSALFANPLERHERARALAFFCQGIDGLVRDPAAAALLTGYGADPETVELALRAGLRLRRRQLTAFGRRATRECKHTAIAGERPRWYLRTDRPELGELARALQLPPPLKSGRRGGVHVWPRGDRGEGLVAKRRTAAAARRLFRACYLLEYAGVPAAAPVAMAIALGEGTVYTARIQEHDLAAELAAGRLDRARIVRMAARLGDAVGRLHAFGLRNRDMKLDNLVRDPGGDTVRMVDLDGVRRRLPLDSRGEGGDLGRLAAAWLDAGQPGAGVFGRFWRAYLRARARLQAPADADLRRVAGRRCAAWRLAAR